MVGYYWGKAVLFIVCRQYHNENTISCVLMTGKHYMYFTIKAAFDNLSLFLLIDLFYSHKTSIANFPDAVLVLFSQFSASTSLTKRKPLTLVRGKIFKRDFFFKVFPSHYIFIRNFFKVPSSHLSSFYSFLKRQPFIIQKTLKIRL